MKKRNDIHRPSVLVVEDYDFVAVLCHQSYSSDPLGEAVENAHNRKVVANHMVASGGKYSNHEHGGSCHICGVWANSMAVFYHSNSNEYIRCGEICAAKLEGGLQGAFKAAKSADEAFAGKMKAEYSLREMGLSAAWDIYQDSGAAFNDYHKGIIFDIVSKLVKYGSISDKQQDFLSKLLANLENADKIKMEREAEKDSALPIPPADSRVNIVGEVLALKWEDGYAYSSPSVLKVLVQHSDGWKVWGSVPKSIKEGLEKGMSISFVAKIKVSEDDSKFGFFSRPSQAEVLR